jgi:hypothetical protein
LGHLPIQLQVSVLHGLSGSSIDLDHWCPVKYFAKIDKILVLSDLQGFLPYVPTCAIIPPENWLGVFLQFLDGHFHGLFDTALQGHRVGPAATAFTPSR